MVYLPYTEYQFKATKGITCLKFSSYSEPKCDNYWSVSGESGKSTVAIKAAGTKAAIFDAYGASCS